MVYLFLDSSGFGGVESHVQQLALLLQQQNIAVEVIFIRRYPDHPQYTFLAKHRIPFRFLSEISGYRFFRKLSRRDVIHAHGYKASLVARVCRVLAPYHLVVSFHAGEALSGRLALYEGLNRITSFLSRNIAVSRRIQATIPFNCELLRNFIFNLPRIEQRQRHTQLQVGFVGRLSIEKGIDRFVWLSQLHPACQFHVFGDGELSSTVVDQPLINWCGAVDSMTPHWSQLDLLVITSRAEGLPMAALEAMAHGVPVVATKVGELESLLPSRSLVAENQWKQLSILVDELDLAGDIAWQQLSQYSQHRIVSHFAADSRWSQLSEIYQLGRFAPS
ncbi:glycosyltransferase family 4 protein [Photobacterium chitinilyticum]|uniref:Glycosyltransferase n=1 Tax=Photobacterium chitinilyticum TaxID=2485123 RepID=A0A3S3QPY9_9GAMM|nr:glycosyltransferase family 4 protein [Photobacterium chitinilyticum]RWX52957.1 glycosyltransferase [Photobacterium chitinilyticum]